MHVGQQTSHSGGAYSHVKIKSWSCTCYLLVHVPLHGQATWSLYDWVALYAAIPCKATVHELANVIGMPDTALIACLGID
jgi:hypothetical protein